VEQAQRVGDHPAREHVLGADRLLEVRQRVARAVGVVLDRDLGHLARAEAPAGHERAGHEAGERRHGGAVGALVGVDRAADDLGDARRRQVRHPLAADDQDGASEPRGDLGEARVEGRGARRRRGLDAHGRHLGEPHVAGDVRGEVAVADELLWVHRRDHDRVGPLEPRRGEGAEGRLGHQVLETLGPTADPRHADPGDPHVSHRDLELAGRARKGQPSARTRHGGSSRAAGDPGAGGRACTTRPGAPAPRVRRARYAA